MQQSTTSKSIIVLLGGMFVVCIAALVLLCILVLRPAQGVSVTPLPYPATSAQEIDRNRFQAIFLTNGQVYFGKLTTFEDAYKLTDVYYLSDGNVENANNNATVIKLGNEVHKPQDKMIIPKTQVLFWENLEDNALRGQLK